MSSDKDAFFELIERLRRRSPELLDLLTAHSDGDFILSLNALLERAVDHLERNKVNFENLDEVGLSAVVAASITTFGVVVTQETHSNGHVDLTIELSHCYPLRRSLGEAKIYDGPEYHIEGLEQLLHRYTTGREGPGFMIVYVRKKEIAGLVRKLRERMDADLPCDQQGSTLDHPIRWSFRSLHSHSCGDNLEVSHIGCNLYSARSKAASTTAS